MQSDVDQVHFSWKLEAHSKDSITLPVYLYANRRNLLFTCYVRPENFEKSLLYERGVSILSNALLS